MHFFLRTLPLTALLMSISSLAMAAGIEWIQENYEARTYQRPDGTKFGYRLMKPKDYDAKKSYPLVLFLHGAGGRGGDNLGQLRDQSDNIAPKFLSQEPLRSKYPCFVVVPQCPSQAGGPLNNQWVAKPWKEAIYSVEKTPATVPMQMVIELLDSLAKEFGIDADRVYVTGLSMGGYGTWDIIARQPKRFAAAMPICGGGDPSSASQLVQMPIWAFHGANDPVVPVGGTRAMIEALNRAGGRPKYTEYPKAGHAAWTPAYRTDGLWEWLFAQKRK